MEIQAVFRLLLKKWWVIPITILVTMISTLIFTGNLPRIYSSTVTYVVSPSPELLNASSFVNGLSVLGGQSTITNTYTSIATSARIRQNAVKKLEINQEQNSAMSVSSRVRSGTNMIEITVEGTNPQLVQQFANQIGQSTLEYVNVLYEVYDMNILDDAVLPVAPIRPDTKMNLALSVVLGFVFGVGLALLLGSMSFSAVPTSSQEKEVSAGQETLENI